VQLDPADGEQDMPTRVSSIGVPDVRAPLSFPKVSSITPVSGPVATIITINGDAISGWRAYVDLGNQRIADGVDISGDSFTVTVPAGMVAGFHRLRINISNLHRSTFYFEVTP
jgi:hypothetical protein